MTQTVPDISPLMPMHQDPLLVCYRGQYAKLRNAFLSSGWGVVGVQVRCPCWYYQSNRRLEVISIPKVYCDWAPPHHPCYAEDGRWRGVCSVIVDMIRSVSCGLSFAGLLYSFFSLFFIIIIIIILLLFFLIIIYLLLFFFIIVIIFFLLSLLLSLFFLFYNYFNNLDWGQSLKCYYLVCIISVRLLVAYLIMVIIECVVGYQLSQRALDIWVLTISGCARIVLLEL